jgi:hypothetical protein
MPRSDTRHSRRPGPEVANPHCDRGAAQARPIASHQPRTRQRRLGLGAAVTAVGPKATVRAGPATCPSRCRQGSLLDLELSQTTPARVTAPIVGHDAHRATSILPAPVVPTDGSYAPCCCGGLWRAGQWRNHPDRSGPPARGWVVVWAIGNAARVIGVHQQVGGRCSSVVFLPHHLPLAGHQPAGWVPSRT